MKILSIETSCDETAVAIININDKNTFAEFNIEGEALYSQAEKHSEYGGVFPELAKREHTKNLVPLTKKVFEQVSYKKQTEAAVKNKEQIFEILNRTPDLAENLLKELGQYEINDIDIIAVTNGPGLAPALWVGVEYANALSALFDIPIIPINHMEGHITSSLVEKNKMLFPTFPAIALLVSGGHTELVRLGKWREYEKIGSTRDDAVGEVFDKVARLLNMPYPGGPKISQCAERARNENIDPVQFPRPMLSTDSFDMSFSGLKTAVRYYIEKHPPVDETSVSAIARGFEEAVVDVLVAKTKLAIESFAPQSIILGGGVAANTHLQENLKNLINKYNNLDFYAPSLNLATDNAVMIALAGFIGVQQGDTGSKDRIAADPTLSL